MRKVVEGVLDLLLVLWIALVIAQYLTLAVAALWQPENLSAAPAGLLACARGLFSGAIPPRLDLRSGYYALGPLLLFGAVARRALPERDVTHDR